MAPNRLTRTVLAGLLLGLAACGKKDEAPAAEAVDLTAIRAQRDSVRRAAVQDSTVRARYKTCSDSVTAAVAKLPKSKRPATAAAAATDLAKACGAVPAAPAAVAQKPDTTKRPARALATKPDSTRVEAPAAQAAKKDSTPARPAAAAPAVQQPAKPALTPQQQQVLRQDSIRQVRERARQDSLRQLAERQRQDSITRAQQDSVRSDSLRVARETEVLRETFTYAGGARDPFASLITQDKVGPEFNDLLLVGVYLDLRRASNSVAVLRDKTNQKRYKLKVGDRLGRLKVAQIRQADVVFTVEDIGFERQETLSLRKREEQTP
ncbi:hypothetical protein [uncultured Arthrobacter sp.]|uniref:hypothetical protein n=1 Tax=uncultured Arthrobacter sp. TaxID=114050 RepID=UPI003217B2C4